MKSNGKSPKIVEVPSIPIGTPPWFGDTGLEDMVERLLVTVAMLDIHTGCVLWLSRNAPKKLSQEQKSLFVQQCLTDASALAHLASEACEVAGTLINREEAFQNNSNIQMGVDLVGTAADWVGNVRELLTGMDSIN